MEQFLEFLRVMGRMLRSRYVRELEREVARLRAENRALLNSLLGTAGVPPLNIPADGQEAGKPGGKGKQAGATSIDSARGKSGAPTQPPTATPPLRRRSWQQIGRMLEIEEARREREHAAQLAQIREKLVSGPVTPEKGSTDPNGNG